LSAAQNDSECWKKWQKSGSIRNKTKKYIFKHCFYSNTHTLTMQIRSQVTALQCPITKNLAGLQLKSSVPEADAMAIKPTNTPWTY
jgi:hypothetical protein